MTLVGVTILKSVYPGNAQYSIYAKPTVPISLLIRIALLPYFLESQYSSFK